MGSYISYLDYYVPKTYIEAKDVLAQTKDKTININYILKHGKLNKISVETKLSKHEMIFNLMDKYINNNLSSDFDAIIFQGADRNICHDKSIPYVLVEKYNMKKATVFALNQECATTLQAIELADGLINSKKAKKILIASICKAETNEERYVFPTILGDGAGILVIENKGQVHIIDSFSKTDGKYSYNKFMDIPYEVCQKNITLNIRDTILTLLEKNNLTCHNIKFIVPQNINEIVYKLNAKALKINVDKFFLRNIALGGHVGDVDNIRNLKELIDEKLVLKNEKFILFGMGMVSSNQTYVATLLERF